MFHEQIRDQRPITMSMFSLLRLTRHFCSRELSWERIVSFPTEMNEAKKALSNLGGEGQDRRDGCVRLASLVLNSFLSVRSGV